LSDMYLQYAGPVYDPESYGECYNVTAGTMQLTEVEEDVCTFTTSATCYDDQLFNYTHDVDGTWTEVSSSCSNNGALDIDAGTYKVVLNVFTWRETDYHTGFFVDFNGEHVVCFEYEGDHEQTYGACSVTWFVDLNGDESLADLRLQYTGNVTLYNLEDNSECYDVSNYTTMFIVEVEEDICEFTTEAACYDQQAFNATVDDAGAWTEADGSSCTGSNNTLDITAGTYEVILNVYTRRDDDYWTGFLVDFSGTQVVCMEPEGDQYAYEWGQCAITYFVELNGDESLDDLRLQFAGNVSDWFDPEDNGECYDVSNMTTMFLKAVGYTCDASTLLSGAADVGDCTSGLASDETCTQTADDGYECTASSCAEDGTFTAGACTAILCEADFHVVNNTCVACDTFTSNDAGDDASGADTTCEADFEGSGFVAGAFAGLLVAFLGAF